MGRIPERPYHACNISERRPFQSPVTQCPCKFPFEINDKEVISRIKDLPQMIISVDSYLHCRNLLLKNTSESIHYFFFTIQHLVCQSFEIIRQIFHIFPQKRKNPFRKRLHGLIEGPLIGYRERFWRKAHIFYFR